MTLFNPHSLRDELRPGLRVMGIDPGKNSIGLALSDVNLSLASPYRSIKRHPLGTLTSSFRDFIRSENIGGFVGGIPFSLDGSFGPAARAAQDWLTDLADRLNLPACGWDERFTTSAVNRFLIQEADMTRKRRAEVVDKMAAAYMLQSWLDATSAPKPV